MVDEKQAERLLWHELLGNLDLGAESLADRFQCLVPDGRVVLPVAKHGAALRHLAVEPIPIVLLELLLGPDLAGLLAVPAVGLEPRHGRFDEVLLSQVGHDIRWRHAPLELEQALFAASVRVVVDVVLKTLELLAVGVEPLQQVAGMRPDAVVLTIQRLDLGLAVAVDVMPAHEVVAGEFVSARAAELAIGPVRVALQPICDTLPRRIEAPIAQSALHRRPRQAQAEIADLLAVLLADRRFDRIGALELLEIWRRAALRRHGGACCGWPLQCGGGATHRHHVAQRLLANPSAASLF